VLAHRLLPTQCSRPQDVATAVADLARVRDALAQHRDAPLLIVEGVFALILPYLRDTARWKVYIDTPADTPADIQIARKTLRKIDEGRDPAPLLRGYLDRGRQAHQTHIEPARHTADLIIDGTQPANLQSNTSNSSSTNPGRIQPPAHRLISRDFRVADERVTSPRGAGGRYRDLPREPEWGSQGSFVPVRECSCYW
jgi:phosphoribulokinase/uridine kinase family protein